MSKISDIYKEIREQQRQVELLQYMLVKTKLQELVKAHKEKRQIPEEEISEYSFSLDDVDSLSQLLTEQGLQNRQNYTYIYNRAREYDEPNRCFLLMKMDGEYISIFAEEGEDYVPTIEPIENINVEDIEYFTDENIYIEDIEHFTDVDLDNFQIETQSKEKEKEELSKPNDTSLEKQIHELSGGDEFLADILMYATKKLELRNKNEQAANLLQDYEQQLPETQKTFEDK